MSAYLRLEVDVYPVGFRSARTQAHFKQQVRYAWRHIQRREWRALRNSFNGYLAEVNNTPPEVSFTRCGRGWTERAALRRLQRMLRRDNPHLTVGNWGAVRAAIVVAVPASAVSGEPNE